MTEGNLIDELLHISGKKAVLKIIEELQYNTEAIDQIYTLTKHSNIKIKWRAAWVFEHLYFLKKDDLQHYLPDIIERLPNEVSDGNKRHFSKIISFSDVNNMINGDFINTCFNWLMSENIPVAVKAHCMQILYNVCKEYPDLKGELIEVIESQIDNNSAGFKSRGRKIINALNK